MVQHLHSGCEKDDGWKYSDSKNAHVGNVIIGQELDAVPCFA